MLVDFLKEYQTYILVTCGFISLLLAFFTLVIEFHSARKKMALIKVEMGISVLLIADAFCYVFKGETSTAGFWILTIGNFVVYTLTLFDIYFLGEYTISLFMEGGRFEKLPRRLLLSLIIPSVGMTFVVLNLFTGWYYTIDRATNMYHRGPLFMMSYIAPLAAVLTMFSFVVQHRKMINKRLLWSLITFIILPITAAVMQYFFYGLSLMHFASWIAAVNLFWFALSDQNDELAAAANTDMVVGLPNTYGYLHEVDQIIQFGDITEYSALYFDIIRMGQINNRYGKRNGDVVIQNYSAFLRNSLEKDEIVGRLGGNFFVALVKKTNTEKFLDLLQGVPIEFETGGRKVTVNVSAIAGVYEVKSKHIAAGQILSNTASAVSYAKNMAHKPYVYLDEKLLAEFARVGKIEEEARSGIEKKEFEPFYQPKIDLRGNMLCGAEALVRWKKDGKMISPAEFIPIMERNGSICDLDFYMLERVCLDIKEWLAKGMEPVTVSVNFSRKNLGNPILAEAISKTVEKYDIPKKYIQVEITETLDEFPLDYLIGVVEALRRYGLSTAIDDFGTGSSSIGLLKSVKFDVLKIDKFFVDYQDENEKYLLNDIIRMANHIGISVIAEGVEEKAQVEELRGMGCFAIQGYIFDKPLPKEEYEKRMMSRKYADLA